MGLSESEAFAAIRAYCLAKPGAMEDYPWGDVAWKIGGKMFACGGEGCNLVSVKSTLEKQAVLVQHPNIERSSYVGRFGWVTVTVIDEATLELCRDLIDESYAAIASKQTKRNKST